MPEWSSFIDRFLARVHDQPDATALCYAGGPASSYRDIHDQAARLATMLRQLGAGPEVVVALGLPRSPQFVVGVLATWWAGAAFVPIDPTLPDARKRLFVSESGARIALTTEDHAAFFTGLNLPVIDVDAPRSATPSLPPVTQPDDLAYVIFTSGSTGQPKGVAVEHRGLVGMLDAQIAAFDVRPGDRCLWMLSPAFDASISDLGTALLSGATLYPAMASEPFDLDVLVRLLIDNRITHVDLPPVLLPLLDPKSLPRSLRTVVIGGEASSPAVVRDWARTRRIVNVYGPTEATVCTSLCVCDPDAWNEPLLGQPLPDVSYHVHDEELFIEGPGLARGYLKQPALTATKFPELDGRRVYRTGDRVRLRADGEYVFLGRVDRQIKLQGRLIEPGEIEACLRTYPGVRGAAVVERSLGSRQALVGFVEPIDASVEQLRNHLARHLPPWMLPTRFFAMDTLPRTASGKIDFAALTTMPLPANTRMRYVDPSRPNVRVLLTTLFSQKLGLERIDENATFLAQGGDSLSLLQIVTAAQAYDVTIPPALLAEGTLKEVVAKLEGQLPVPSSHRMSIGELRGDVHQTLATLLRIEPRSRPTGRPKHVLLTGGTGFLGSHVLRELLDRTNADVYCIVRCGIGTRPLDRLCVTSPRIHVFRGDLAQFQLGLLQCDYEGLSEQVDTIYHCAGEVNLLATYHKLRNSNVRATAELLRFANLGVPKRLHHVSTLSVLVATDCNTGTLFESDNLSQTNHVYGGYAQSKWAAEWLVRSVGGAHIHRPGLITGHSQTGISASNDFLTLFLRGLSELGCYPDVEDLYLDVTPVDFAAAALVHLSLNPPQFDRTYHLTGSGRWSLRNLVAGLCRRGFPMAPINPTIWPHRVSELQRRSPKAATACLALCRSLGGAHLFSRLRTMDLFQATGVTFDARNTLAGLEGSGIVCPPANDELLDRYLTKVFPQ